MNILLPAFAMFALVAAPAQEKKTVPPAKGGVCCEPKCRMKGGTCVTHSSKKCAEACTAACCKPAKKAEHPKGEHPKAEHPKGEHPKGEHPKGEHPKGEHPKG